MNSKKKNIITLVILPIAFLILHFISKNNEILDLIPVISSTTPQELSIEKLELKNETYPGYLNPFQTLERSYVVKGGDEIVLIEKGSLFGSDMEITMGNPADYYDEKTDGMFYRGFAADDYPNTIFFIIQYFIVILFGYLVCKTFFKKS